MSWPLTVGPPRRKPYSCYVYLNSKFCLRLLWTLVHSRHSWRIVVALLKSLSPRETRGYRFQLFCPSVCPASCPVYISESTQRRIFVRFDEKMWKWLDFENVWKLGNVRPRVRAIFPKVYIRVLLFIRIRIKHILKVCNVVFWIKLMKNVKTTDFCKFIKFDKILVNIRPHVQAVSPKAYIGAFWSIHRWIKHITKVCNVAFWFEWKIVKMTAFCKLINFYKI